MQAIEYSEQSSGIKRMKHLDYHEVEKRGTVDFPLQYYRISPFHPRYEMSHHWHMDCEFLHVLEGSLQVTIDNQKLTMNPGDIVFLQPGLLHSGMPVNCVYDCIVFDLSYFFKNTLSGNVYLQAITHNTLLVQQYYPYEENSEIYQMVTALFHAVRNNPDGYELTALGHLYQFLGYLIEHKYYTNASEITQKNNNKIIQIKKALELIETSYGSYLTLEDMAATTNMNSKYFCRFFQEMTKRTPIDYLNYYRIEMACFQLATSNASITEVALNCGFNDLSYFIKTFKKYKGVTPKKYVTTTI